MEEFVPLSLPLNIDLETKRVIKKATSANKALAELKGISNTIPNQAILINSLVLKEAKDSSEIENIITTHDELYQSIIDIGDLTKESKEVKNYKNALLKGFDLIGEKNLLLVRHIVEIQKDLEQNDAGIRQQSGTVLKNDKTGEIMLKPPQSKETIESLLANLEKYINADNDDVDFLIKMAIIHYQFEVIHPFYDGNGRTGRIINVLYLVLKGLLNLPILYLSHYIIKHKNDYYRLLREVQTNQNYEDWIMYILDAVETTSKETIILIEKINRLMGKTQIEIQNELPKIYSKDLVDALFLHPYTKISHLTEALSIHRDTAATYLNELEKRGILSGQKKGRNRYFVNTKLFELLKESISQ